jgi:hypothetical protein
VLFDAEPACRANDNNRDPARREVLLLSQVLVGGNKNFEAGGLSFLQQFAVRQRAPLKLGCRADLMLRMISAQRRRCTLIEQNAHSHRFQRAGRMLENKPGLFLRDAGKPGEKIRQLRSVFQILEQGSDRNARVAKHPGAAEALRMPLDGGTGRPVDHDEMLWC